MTEWLNRIVEEYRDRHDDCSWCGRHLNVRCRYWVPLAAITVSVPPIDAQPVV